MQAAIANHYEIVWGHR